METVDDRWMKRWQKFKKRADKKKKKHLKLVN